MRMFLALASTWLVFAAGCVNLPENYKPAGFATAEEAKPFVRDYLYYARKLSADEWSVFYARFPEYQADMQKAKAMPLGGAPDFHPWYTAYAFRWTTLRRKEAWSPDTLARLGRREVLPGDDIFQVTHALGSPDRVLHDNFFEILLYGDGKALLFGSGRLSETRPCPKCFLRWESRTQPDGMFDEDILRTLGLKRPSY